MMYQLKTIGTICVWKSIGLRWLRSRINIINFELLYLDKRENTVFSELRKNTYKNYITSIAKNKRTYFEYR